jgi:uncharacterized protein YraI
MHFLRSTRTLCLLLSLAVVTLFVGLQPTQAAGGALWSGAYYDNEFLSGTPTFVRQDAEIAFNWGNGAPAPGMSVDNFSVRWSTDVYLDAGTYRFSVVADDAVYLRVDNAPQPQINTFGTRAVGQVVNVDIPLSAGTHHIQLDYVEYTGDANVLLSWVNLMTGVTNAPPVTSPSIGEAPQPVVSGGSGPWTAQYFGNVDFYGSPLLTVAEASPSHNWGTGSPAPNIPADNFSVRWTSFPTLTTGNYRLNVSADDGVRVYVDGILTINEWHVSAAATYTVTLALAAGQHFFQVDYYESGGLAFIDFSFTPVVDVAAPPAPANPAAVVSTGRVNTGERLNVRSEPNASAQILAKIRRTHTYPIIGRTADSSWWQINVDGTIGWVYWRYIDVTNPGAVPVVAGAAAPAPAPVSGLVVAPTTNLNLRSGPTTTGAIIGRVPQGTQVSVVGRNADASWWQINDGRTVGWIASRYAPLPAGTSINTIPVTG